MGYYSDIGIMMKQDTFQELINHLSKFSFDGEPGEDIVVKYNDGLRYFHSSQTVLLRFSDMKWYKGYEWVDQIEAFIAKLDEDDYHFVRSGEELDDNEDDGELSDWNHFMYVKKQVYVSDEKDSIKYDPTKYYISINISLEDELRYAELIIEDLKSQKNNVIPLFKKAI